MYSNVNNKQGINLISVVNVCWRMLWSLLMYTNLFSVKMGG